MAEEHALNENNKKAKIKENNATSTGDIETKSSVPVSTSSDASINEPTSSEEAEEASTRRKQPTRLQQRKRKLQQKPAAQ